MDMQDDQKKTLENEENAEVTLQGKETTIETVEMQETPEKETVDAVEDVMEKVEEKQETVEKTQEETAKEQEAPTIVSRLEDKDFTTFSEEKMVATLKLLVEEADFSKVRELVDKLQGTFYRQYNEAKKKAFDLFIEDGGVKEDFSYSNLYEEQICSLLAKYRDKKAALNKRLEEQKQENLNRKEAIIEGIKNLINKQESLSETFKEFHALQDEWRALGAVPQPKINELWRNYHFHVENFYDYIRINKELRDLDFKKNLEIKTALLEEAKALTNEGAVKKAFDRLQKLHDKWKEAGPVKRELRESLWNEFKETSRIIHKKHQDFFVNLKNEQKENLAKKEILCEKAENLLNPMPETNKQWNKVANLMKELQEDWKTVGFAPKKYNQDIYERFRKACDAFFQAKREAHKSQRDEFKANMDKKIELCEMAEAVMNSEDWKMTTDYLIDLQKQWKTVGAVQYKYSQKLWDRFRAACDHFFDRRSGKVEAANEEQQAENLAKKQEVIQQIENFDTEGSEAPLKELQKLQADFHSIGFVPIKEKETVVEAFNSALKSQLEKLDVTEEEMHLQQFIGKYTALMQEPNGEGRVVKERLHLANQAKQIENNIVVWGNNIGFFSNSSNAEKLIAEVEGKIANAKEELKGLYQKLRVLDKLLQ